MSNMVTLRHRASKSHGLKFAHYFHILFVTNVLESLQRFYVWLRLGHVVYFHDASQIVQPNNLG